MSARTKQQRAAEERYLLMLEMRRDGMSVAEISDALGVAEPTVTSATTAIRKADEEEAAKSGEDTSGAYWPVQRGRPRKA